MTTWFKPKTDDGFPFLCRNDWFDHDGMVEAFVEECLSKLRTDYDNDFEAFEQDMRIRGREPYGVNFGSNDPVEDRMRAWCYELCLVSGVDGDYYPATAAPEEDIDYWLDMPLTEVFEGLDDGPEYSEDYL